MALKGEALYKSVTDQLDVYAVTDPITKEVLMYNIPPQDLIDLLNLARVEAVQLYIDVLKAYSLDPDWENLDSFQKGQKIRLGRG